MSAAGSGAVQGWQLLMPAMPSVQASASLAAAQAVHVAGFGKVVDVFSSKQRPKKLTIYGDDFRCHCLLCYNTRVHTACFVCLNLSSHAATCLPSTDVRPGRLQQ